MALGQEDQLQIAVCEYAELRNLPFFHVANERRCSMQYGRLLKRKGVKPGFSDCFMPRGNHTFKGLFIELKIKPNKPTPNQLIFIENMISEGYAAHVCYSLVEAIIIIDTFYGFGV